MPYSDIKFVQHAEAVFKTMLKHTLPLTSSIMVHYNTISDNYITNIITTQVVTTNYNIKITADAYQYRPHDTDMI